MRKTIAKAAGRNRRAIAEPVAMVTRTSDDTRIRVLRKTTTDAMTDATTEPLQETTIGVTIEVPQETKIDTVTEIIMDTMDLEIEVQRGTMIAGAVLAV